MISSAAPPAAPTFGLHGSHALHPHNRPYDGPGADPSVMAALHRFFHNPSARAGNRKMHETYLEMRSDWARLPPEYVRGVLDAVMVGEGVDRDGWGCAAFWLNNPAKASPELRAILSRAVSARREAVARQAAATAPDGVTVPGDYVTPNGNRVSVVEVWDGLAELEDGTTLALGRTRGWVPAAPHSGVTVAS